MARRTPTKGNLPPEILFLQKALPVREDVEQLPLF
jgi:hypothetical protein